MYLDFIHTLSYNKINLGIILANIFQTIENKDEQVERVKEV